MKILRSSPDDVIEAIAFSCQAVLSGRSFSAVRHLIKSDAIPSNAPSSNPLRNRHDPSKGLESPVKSQCSLFLQI